MKDSKQFKNLNVVNHPLVQHKLTILRRRETPTNNFRRALKELGSLMGYEVTRSLSLNYVTIQTPITEMQAPVIAGRKLVIVPILRAALGMSDGLLQLLPSARVGHIGIYRDEETFRPVQYLCKLPDPKGRLFIVVDPMLATGNTAMAAIDLLNKQGVPDQRIRFLSLIAAPEGVNVFCEAHPKIEVYVAAIDDHLNEKAFIVPGLGDAGDRLFGTKE